MSQYLSRYAEKETSCLDGFKFNYDHLLCIPAFAEKADFLDKVIADIRQQSVLVILVVNAHVDASPAQISLTRDIATTLKQQHQSRDQLAENICLLEISNSLDVLLVERCIPGLTLEGNDGVGLARKIACDMACTLIAQGNSNSSWIHSTDADAILPADYFASAATLDSATTSAAIYPFQHSLNGNKKIQQAQNLYDLSINYYVAGLAWAESRWAYHTIGSTLLINARHYAQARGFPKRQAGEDFYLLNKLAKIGTVVSLTTTPITLDSRLSDRVPFGTGPALNKIMAMTSPLDEYLYYHPNCFLALKFWLLLMRQIKAETQVELTINTIEDFRAANNKEFSDLDSEILLLCLRAMGAERALEHAFTHSKSKASLDRHLQNWFDSFRTLKFIHWMRDNQFPSLSLQGIQKEANFPFISRLTESLPAKELIASS